jgi:hypothetical protein
MLAARIEPKNRRKFKPLALGQNQTTADTYCAQNRELQGALAGCVLPNQRLLAPYRADAEFGGSRSLSPVIPIIPQMKLFGCRWQSVVSILAEAQRGGEMPGERLSMRKMRDLLRLLWEQDLPQRVIANIEPHDS